ncbi:plasmid replication initiator RepA [Kosakonia cowanii]|uniref:plasmid replication initiator RepA n=1 Tax=Kosakonia cowanii TaxID=208223 RepID=UPI0025A9643D|nr:plasmid replication initiator RepA [Kosakonia cowanii]MDM9617498.1 plasmid replication initiator RepA [Kosakonia cowanii]MDP4562617.1 plasmid replication initiator RepA [Kosakonia cowanii]WRY61885.1 plasmid replication initiator RepA [Kosakonia cowanii]
MNDNLKPRDDRRHRGTHSTACKCPAPQYVRPAHYKALSKEHGRALRNLIARDKTTGEWVIRRRVSADPLFTFLRPQTDRKRAFYPERRNLFDALFILFLNKVDLATDIVTINTTKLAEELSPRDEQGNIIPEEAVTVSRVSRLITALVPFGVIEEPESEWDVINNCRFPKHIIITEAGWRLTGVDMDKLRAEQEARRAAIQDGQLAPGETLSLKAARRRWYERCRHQTILSRRTRALEGKQRKKLAALPFDERKRQVSEDLMRSMKGRTGHMTHQQFEKLVWSQLYQLELVSLEPPGTSPPH